MLVTFCGMLLFLLAFYQIRRIQEDMVNIADGRAQYLEKRDLPALRDFLRRRPAGARAEVASRPAPEEGSDAA